MKTSHELPLRPDATVSSGKRRSIGEGSLLARAGRLALQVLNVPALSRASSLLRLLEHQQIGETRLWTKTLKSTRSVRRWNR
jgi:hypothetical protein